MALPLINSIKYRVVRGFEKKVLSEMDVGTNIYDHDWDVLLVLDACRYDLFQEFAPKHKCYEWFSDVRSIRSVASSTQVWLPRTFLTAPSNSVERTHYISGIGQTKKHLPQDIFYKIEDVWEYANSPNAQTNLEAITDATINAVRTSGASRFIAHYPAPHAPFYHCMGKYEYPSHGKSQTIWNKLANGEVDKDEIWEDYGQNLLIVLDEVETIIRNTEGKIVVTSDHGNALGELGFYGHPRHVPISAIRKVPWAEADRLGKDNYEIKGKEEMTTDVENLSVEENLEALGYI